VETRKLKRARIEAAKRDEAVLDDVDLDGAHGSKSTPAANDLETGTKSSTEIESVSVIDKEDGKEVA
jgi:hypothetical protein